jgi:hypothetical protein
MPSCHPPPTHPHSPSHGTGSPRSRRRVGGWWWVTPSPASCWHCVGCPLARAQPPPASPSPTHPTVQQQQQLRGTAAAGGTAAASINSSSSSGSSRALWYGCTSCLTVTWALTSSTTCHSRVDHPSCPEWVSALAGRQAVWVSLMPTTQLQHHVWAMHMHTPWLEPQKQLQLVLTGGCSCAHPHVDYAGGVHCTALGLVPCIAPWQCAEHVCEENTAPVLVMLLHPVLPRSVITPRGLPPDSCICGTAAYTAVAVQPPSPSIHAKACSLRRYINACTLDRDTRRATQCQCNHVGWGEQGHLSCAQSARSEPSIRLSNHAYVQGTRGHLNAAAFAQVSSCVWAAVQLMNLG